MSTNATTIALVGDLMLARGISEAAQSQAPAHFWGDVLSVLQSADAVIGNLESPVTTSGAEWRQCWKAFRFAAHPRTIELLSAANVRAVALANNHILDRRGRGLCDTLAHLDAAGIDHAGAGRHLEEAVRPAILDLGSLRVGIIALTDNMPEFAAGPCRPGTNYVRIANSGASIALIDCLMRELRRSGAEFIVLSAHWGPNLRPWPPAHFRAFARAAIDLGADLCHGHSAHLFQGVEARGHGLILYDTGDFLDDYWTFPFIRTDRSFLFLVDLFEGRLMRLRMFPVIVTDGRVMRARGAEADAVQRSMIRRCRPLGTLPYLTPRCLELDLPAPPPVGRCQSRLVGGLFGLRWRGRLSRRRSRSTGAQSWAAR
jgi:poly-gamma-glutamate capsule biosynthesis protein CapA/YwtB (metallophosphatase superfamily)